MEIKNFTKRALSILNYPQSTFKPLIIQENVLTHDKIRYMLEWLLYLSTYIDVNKFVTSEEMKGILDEIAEEFALHDATQKKYTDEQIRVLDAVLRSLINEVTIGNIVVTDPSFGKWQRDIETVLYSMFDDVRDYGALTAKEYDELIAPSVSVADWDAMEFTAFEYDIHSRRIFEVKEL